MPRASQSLIYFSVADNLVAIGLYAGAGRLLGTMFGDALKLRAIEQKFDRFRAGARFHAAPELLSWIADRCTPPTVNAAASERLTDLVPPHRRATLNALAKMISDAIFRHYKGGAR